MELVLTSFTSQELDVAPQSPFIQNHRRQHLAVVGHHRRRRNNCRQRHHV